MTRTPTPKTSEPSTLGVSAGHPFRLGDVEIHPAEGELRRPGQVARVDLKAMAVLCHLAANAGRVASKSQILSAVWPDTVVEEVALARAVSELREALGDDARQPRYVETLHKRGYRLIAPVAPIDEGTPPRVWTRHQARLGLAGVVAVGALLSITLIPETPTPMSGPVGNRPVVAIVVLPLENLGPSEHAHFAAGLTEEITSRLAAVRGLRVISRTSANRYAASPKPVPQIGRELGVDYVLEGSVLWSGARDSPGSSPGRVRLTPQLIRVKDDSHAWSQVYDRNAEDLLRLQTELARRVIGHLGVELLGVEALALESTPTDSLEAYEAYLEGLDAAGRFVRFGPEDLRRGIERYERAVELDARFAEAHAQLSFLNTAAFHMGYDRTRERLDRAREAAETALRLEPALGRGHMALGYYYYWGLGQYDRALAEFQLAQERLPNDSDVTGAIAYIRRRQGHLAEAISLLEAARLLDPQNARLALELGRTYHLKRQYLRAAMLYDDAIELHPKLTAAYEARAWLALEWQGDAAEARRVLDRMPTASPIVRAVIEGLAGDYREALRWLDRSAEEHLSTFSFTPPSLIRAWFLDAMEEKEAARKAYDAARLELEPLAHERPEDPRLHMSLGMAYAGLGRKADAMRHGLTAVELMPLSEDALGGPKPLADLARIYALVGEHDAALDQLEHLMSIPAGSWVSPALLRLDPRFRALKDLPRFQALMAQGSFPTTRSSSPPPRE